VINGGLGKFIGAFLVHNQVLQHQRFATQAGVGDSGLGVVFTGRSAARSRVIPKVGILGSVAGFDPEGLQGGLDGIEGAIDQGHWRMVLVDRDTSIRSSASRTSG
jgi:hypothetical protein